MIDSILTNDFFNYSSSYALKFVVTFSKQTNSKIKTTMKSSTCKL